MNKFTVKESIITNYKENTSLNHNSNTEQHITNIKAYPNKAKDQVSTEDNKYITKTGRLFTHNNIK
jgi:hypothetical protein